MRNAAFSPAFDNLLQSRRARLDMLAG